MRSFFYHLRAPTALTLLGLAACTPLADVAPGLEATRPVAQSPAPAAIAATGFPETFESGSKTSYAVADVTLGSGSWKLDNALIGTSTSDAKTGTKSVRVTASGIVTMNFNTTTGASTVAVQHAVYGADAAASWQLWQSVNNGSSWTQVGSTVTSSSTALQTSTFTVNVSGAIRFQIRKVSGTGRLNFDNFAVEQFSTTTGGGTTGGGTTGGGTVGGPATRDDNMGMGNPSGAVANTASPDNYLMNKTMYALSYNRSKATPNWVSWHLSTAWKGGAARSSSFLTDQTLPSGWYRVSTNDYTNSGFDRGHMCPSDDRDYSSAENQVTFTMTNIIPQAPANNQGPWAQLETYCRTLASAGNELYIISGPGGSGGAGTNGSKTVLTNGVAVPNYTWKVAVVLPIGTGDAARVTSATRVIAIRIPNNQTVQSTSWGQYRVSVDQIESLTGYNLLSAVTASVQDVVESRIDAGPTQ